MGCALAGTPAPTGRRAGVAGRQAVWLAMSLALAFGMYPAGLGAEAFAGTRPAGGVSAPPGWTPAPALGSLAGREPDSVPASAFEGHGPPHRNDGNRTVAGYGPNLARSFVGVLAPRNYGLFLVAGAAASAAHALDDRVVDHLERHPHRTTGQVGRVLGGSIAVGSLTVGLFGAGRLAGGDRFRASTYDLSQAVVVTSAWTTVLKLAARRQRPNGSDRLSFPSGHASNAFTIATVVAHHHPRLALPGYSLASFIALSRMADEAHHLSDVVAGASLGVGVARAVVRRGGRPPEAWRSPGPGLAPRASGEPRARAGRTLSLQPDAGPSGDGLGLALSVSF